MLYDIVCVCVCMYVDISVLIQIFLYYSCNFMVSAYWCCFLPTPFLHHGGIKLPAHLVASKHVTPSGLVHKSGGDRVLLCFAEGTVW